MNSRRFRFLIWAGLLLVLPFVLWAAGQARLGQTTDLKASPHTDAALVKQLAAGTTVEVLQRQGGWYQVKSGNVQGWVRMSSVQFAEPAAQSSGAGDALSFLSSGRSSATQATATTGVRGLDETQLAQATPDMAAVGRMEQLAAREADARQFAAQAPLQAVIVADLPQAAPK